MKKMELFKISPEGAALVKEYDDTRKAEDGVYLDPYGKRTRIMKAADELQQRICRVSDEHPSFGEVAKMATQIAEDCLKADSAPTYNMTKAEVYAAVVKRLQPILDRELLGKFICIKTGPWEFKYIKVTKVEAQDGIYGRLQVWVSGPGFGEFAGSDYNGEKQFPSFKKFSVDCTGLLVTGKDEFEYKKRWMYVMSPEAIREKLDDVMAEFRERVGLDDKEDD